MLSERMQYQVPRQGWLFLIELSKWYFSKYRQVRTRQVFTQTFTNILKSTQQNE